MNAEPRAVRVALPRGDLRSPLAERLDARDFHVEGYGEGARTYRLDVRDRPDVAVRVFSDGDIPIQVALGNYDLAVTSGAWISELQARYAQGAIARLRALDLPGERVVLAGPEGATLAGLAARRPLRVATLYPRLTAGYLNALRVPDYRLIEVWDRPHLWPPDDADAAVFAIPAGTAEDPRLDGLEVLAEILCEQVWLIANRDALARRDLAAALDPLVGLPAGPDLGPTVLPGPIIPAEAPPPLPERDPDVLRIALPDGHAHPHTVEALAAAGIAFDGYDADRAVRRPTSTIDGIEAKVIRPQDMPQAVALGRFDLAFTGRDWLAAHLAAFPSSPVEELADLARSRYQLGAVVEEDLPAQTIGEAVAYWRRDDPRRAIRIASEYVALADRYARDRHLGRYRVIPISGASEGFVPEDADILIEGSETGTTLRANRLRMIDVIMESTNCAIGSTMRPEGRRGELRDRLVGRLRAAEGGA